MSREPGDLPTAVEIPQIPDFELLRVIGRGSYGDVWLARSVTGLWRAIKVVWRDRFINAGPFEREFKGLKEFAAISLGESVQMALLHVGRNEAAGFFYYVMELADDVKNGRQIEPSSYVPLTLAHTGTPTETRPAAECIQRGLEVARALAGLHAHGLVHRDIKPSNIIIVIGVAKLADIGLVSAVTDARTFVGTDGYVPPEGPGSPAADIYALGKVLFELVTGLDRQDFPQLPAGLSRRPDRRLVMELNEIILRACDSRPEKRYRDGGALLLDLQTLQSGRSLQARLRWRRVARASAVAALAGLGAFVFLRWSNLRRTIPATGAPEMIAPVTAAGRSIVVLPFANLSPEKDSEFFADGICENVLTGLTGIRTLRVVSRTSALQYRDTKKPIPQIARELGVTYIVEGSVQRQGDKVRVTTELIRAGSDEQVWAHIYDGELRDIFTVQTAIAQEIAAALQTAISPNEKATLERRPTENLAAYDLYLEARALLERPFLGEALYKVEAKLRQCLALDPNFAAAWAELGDCDAHLYFYEDDRTPERLRSATEAIETAVRLAPEDPVVIARLGSYYFHAHRDYIRAAEQVVRLARLRPNDPELPSQLANIQSHQGRWGDAIIQQRRALELDPGNLTVAGQMVEMLNYVRRYDEAETIARRFTREFPLEEQFWAQLAIITFNAHGSIADMQEFDRHAFEPERMDHVLYLRKRLARMRGDFAMATRLDVQQPIASHGSAGWQQRMVAAVTLENSGHVVAARARVKEVIGEITDRAARQPTNSWLQAWLGQAHAILGERQLALEAAQRGIDLMPEASDAVFGPTSSTMAVSVWARFGDTDRALAEFARLLRTPAGPHVASARFGVGDGPTEVSWGPLVKDPRFQALLMDPKNNAPLL